MLLSILLESHLKKALKEHPELAERCYQEGEKDIVITLLPIEKHWTITLSQGEIRCFGGKAAKDPALHITITPQSLIALAVREDKTGLKLEGDVMLAQLLERLLYAWPADLFASEKVQKKGQVIKNYITDYLQEEAALLPLSSEVKQFCDEVDELKWRVDRFEARWKLNL